MAEGLPFSKISIPGPTLASLLHHSLPSSSSSSAVGLLFGHVAALPPLGLTDVDPTPSSSSLSLSLSLSITSFVSLPFFDSLGLVDPTENPNPTSSSLAVVGWFSSRSRSQIRPSMRDLSVSRHLSQTLILPQAPSPSSSSSKACVFLLLSSFSTSNQAVHTHEYRAFVAAGPGPGPDGLRQVSIDVINVGPKFRGQYGSFSPESSLGLFPMIGCRVRVSDEGEGCMETENNKECGNGEWKVDGFGFERLEGLIGEKAAEYTRELEDLYAKMMGKLEGLVRMVEESSVKVQEQESRNSVLRNKIAGFE